MKKIPWNLIHVDATPSYWLLIWHCSTSDHNLILFIMISVNSDICISVNISFIVRKMMIRKNYILSFLNASMKHVLCFYYSIKRYKRHVCGQYLKWGRCGGKKIKGKNFFPTLFGVYCNRHLMAKVFKILCF